MGEKDRNKYAREKENRNVNFCRFHAKSGLISMVEPFAFPSPRVDTPLVPTSHIGAVLPDVAEFS